MMINQGKHAKLHLSRLEKHIIVAILVLLLLIAGILTYRFLYFNRETVFLTRESDSSEAAICISPDNSATRAAAAYLAGTIRETLGIELPIVTEPADHTRYITIVCDPESAGRSETQPAYTVILEEQGIVIRTQPGIQCFGAVRAVTDQWFREDCGLKGGKELRLSRKMIATRLSLLPTAIPGQLKVLSQNLCYSNDGPGLSVNERAKRFFQLVEQYQPDLIGTQECTPKWKEILENGLGDRYEIYGISLDGPNSEVGDREAILYRKDRFQFRDGGTFWLSNTPDEPRSQLYYDGVQRICTWALLTDSETEKTLLFSNTHLHPFRDDYSQEVRARQTEILLRYLRRGTNKLAHYPGFLTGDFNGEPKERFYSEATAYYSDSGNTAITNSSVVDYTFHDYDNTQRLYDYCFHSPQNVTILDYHILDDQYDGFVSDHYGVLVTTVLN